MTKIYIKRNGFQFCGRVYELQQFWNDLDHLLQSGLTVKEFCEQQLN